MTDNTDAHDALDRQPRTDYAVVKFFFCIIKLNQRGKLKAKTYIYMGEELSGVLEGLRAAESVRLLKAQFYVVERFT